MRAPLMMLCAVFAAGCGGKKAAPAAAGGSSGSSAAEITAEMPDTGEARGFAKRLVETTVTDWSPNGGGGGVSFRYKRLSFAPDGTWDASAELAADFESIACDEKGTWRIEEAPSNTEATMTWTVTTTRCPSRESGAEQRVLMAIPKSGDAQISFR